MASTAAPLSDLISYWAQDDQSRLQPRTLAEYRRYIELFLGEVDKPLDDVTRYDVRAWLDSHGWADGTRHFALRSINSCFKWLTIEGTRDR